jgi:hypothetical protein
MKKKEAKQIKEMKLEIERLKKLPDYEYVIMDIQEEIKCLKKKLEKSPAA